MALKLKVIASSLLLLSCSVNAASSLREICTDYVKYLGHAYGYAVSEDQDMLKLLKADMKRLKLSEAMVEKTMREITSDQNSMWHYSALLNPKQNPGAVEQMVSYCMVGPDMMIPSWSVLVATGKVRQEDTGKSVNSYLQSDEFLNSPGMRHQKVEGTLAERAYGKGTSTAMGNLSIDKEAKLTPELKKCVDEKLSVMKKDSPDVPEANLIWTATSLCKDGY